MDGIFDAVFDLFLWPVITVLSILKYSLREYYKRTPKSYRTIRVFLKNGIGWAAILLITQTFQTGIKNLYIFLEIQAILKSSIVLHIFISLFETIVPLLCCWFLLGWKNCRHGIMRIALLRDGALMFWSAYILQVLLLEPFLKSVSPFIQHITRGPLAGMLLFQIMHTLTRKYLKHTPRIRSYSCCIVICVPFYAITTNILIDLFRFSDLNSTYNADIAAKIVKGIPRVDPLGSND